MYPCAHLVAHPQQGVVGGERFAPPEAAAGNRTSRNHTHLLVRHALRVFYFTPPCNFFQFDQVLEGRHSLSKINRPAVNSFPWKIIYSWVLGLYVPQVLVVTSVFNPSISFSFFHRICSFTLFFLHSFSFPSCSSFHPPLFFHAACHL